MIQTQYSYEDLIKNAYKCVKVHESCTVLCGGKLQTLKLTYQQTECAVFTQTESLFFSSN